ncbi:zinc finger protein 831 isoform X2 [Melanotaenia boesemani]|uniref:zinc finger protein 831 isoform X2 n=1 Tax=Melanotaenia boesemani TaxID=1250792 RepID=UPI001C0501FB|nr:zinc finger protein 831 isoform X2 [Melanotaenia boesemani]
METGKPGLASVPMHIRSIAAPVEKRMDVQAPLTAVYIHTVPYPQPPAAAREPSTLHLATPPLYSKETLPFLTLHLAGGLQSLPGLSLAAGTPSAKPKSAGKHVCPHCGRDCMKPSVLEKHLRCHTGERPYPCTTCGVSFKTQSNLYKHRRTQAHARLSSESEQSSLDSISSSRETRTSSLSLDERSEEPGSVESSNLPAAESSTLSSTTEMQQSLCKQKEGSLAVHNTETNGSEEVGKEEDKQEMENTKPPLPVSRHLPLKRQEAMLFSKQWECSVSRGKSQSHSSTDSGFSEIGDHYPSPGSVLPDHSMDSLVESNKEHLEESTRTHTPSGESRHETKDTAREQEQKILEERISKLISENTAVVEDKQLENVRPRKTVLSKQGSIDLPMPYTYKDSFHFDMKISPAQHIGLQRHIKPGLHSSVPTQRSSTMEHAPLTRSNSLPFSVALLQPERSSPTSSYQSDYVTPARRRSSGQINPTCSKPVNQHSSTHHPLVRQTAVDCNHATDGLFSNSSVEEACTGSLSCDGDGGDICDEPNTRKIRRKKPQKFFYKWYMYRGGTFKRLYNAETTGDNSTSKGRKCSTNPEVVLQKPALVDHKETGSAISITNSAATVAHQSASLPLISSVDFSHLNSSIKAPLRRNLSLSVLPSPTTGSLLSYKTECVSRTEAERPVNAEQQPRGAHIPSDRKKQRTDDKITSSLGMLTDPNTSTRPPPSATANVLLQDANLTFINFTKDPNHTELQGAVFPSSMLNAKAPSVRISPTTSVPTAAKSSFLPKYQLKLPNTPDPDPRSSQTAVGKPKGSDDYSLTAPPSTASDQTSPSGATCVQNCGNLFPCDVGRMKTFSSTQEQLALTCAVTALSKAAASQLSQSLASSVTVVHRQLATSTQTTSCLRDSHAGLCNALMQPLRSAAGSVPPRLPTPAPADANLSVTTVNNLTSAATVSAFSQSQPYLSPNTPLSQASNPGNSAHVSSNTPTVPLNHVQPAQNIFHVHTADLQICLQIISDEQLALIAPQIERTPGMSLSHTPDVEAMTQEDPQNKAQNSLTVEKSYEAENHEQQGNEKKTERKSLPTLNSEAITPPLSGGSVKGDPGPHLAEHSTSNKAAASANSNLSLHPHKYAPVSTVMQPQSSAGDVVPTAASLRGRTSDHEHYLPPNSCTEEQFSLDRRAGRSQPVSGQHMLSVSPPSTSTPSQSGMKGELAGKESQHKLPDHGAWCKNSQLEGGEVLSQADSAAHVQLQAPGQLNSQASVYCCQQQEPILYANQNPSKPASLRCNTVGPSDCSSSCLEVTELQDPQKHSGPFTSLSSNFQVERQKDEPAVCTSVQSPTTEECAAQKELQTQEHAGTALQPQRTDWRPKQSQAEAETHPQAEGQRAGGGGATGEDRNREAKEMQIQLKRSSRSIFLPETTRIKEEEPVDKNCLLPEQHLQDRSRTHSGMSECHPSAPHKTPATFNNSTLPPSSIHASLLNSLPLDIKQFPPFQQSWDNIIHKQQTQEVHETSSTLATAQLHLSESHHVFSRTEPSLQQTHPVSHQQLKQTSISLSVQNTSTGNYSTSVSWSGTLASTSARSNLCRTTAALTADSQDTGSPFKSATYLEDYSSQSSNIPSKYQSVFMGGSLHGFQPADFLTSDVRPVQSCYREDSSSSDDEGKLIIEL